MKKTLFFVVVLSLLVSSGLAFAAKTTDTGAYIKDGTILDKFGNVIPLGYNNLGYNYEAHMFNGKYCDAYNDADWCQQFKDVSLMMKWNDAWLSNRDRGTQGNDQLAYTSTTTPDNKLDRHYPTDSYIGSGAWLTNHAVGTYASTQHFHWNVNTAANIVHIPWAGTDYQYSVTFGQSGTVLTGTLTDGYYPTTGPLSGTLNGSDVTFSFAYPDGSVQGLRTYIGTIDSLGNATGTWSETGAEQATGTWTIYGFAVQSPDICEVSDFVKIVAVPSGAIQVGDKWQTADGAEIGPAIWGPFAIIQEIATDPCGEYGVINYMSPLKKGLGHW